MDKKKTQRTRVMISAFAPPFSAKKSKKTRVLIQNKKRSIYPKLALHRRFEESKNARSTSWRSS
ncbi:MAG: hypothetical protein VX809_06065, partial [Pseudomonadota bacterium]|nr:hypothetical protein [Pseudomonadota bacterium]